MKWKIQSLLPYHLATGQVHMYYTINLLKNHKIFYFLYLNVNFHDIFILDRKKLMLMSKKRSKKKKNNGFKIFFTLLIIFVGVILVCYHLKSKNNDKPKEEIKVTKENKKEEVKKEEPKEEKNKEEKKEDVKTNNTSNDKESYPALTELDGEKEVIGTSSKGYTIYTKSGVTYVDGIMIVNKSYALPDDYYPINTHTNAKGVTSVCNGCINNTAYNAFNDMKADAQALGLNIWIQSGYRPYSSQETIYNRYVSSDGQAAADTYSARPGNSEHQSGLCFDLNSISDEFANTQEGKWVNDNAYRYGFIIRFPKRKQDYTGYKYESWHLRYVGSELAEKLYNNGDWLSLEEYFGLSSEYKN